MYCDFVNNTFFAHDEPAHSMVPNPTEPATVFLRKQDRPVLKASKSQLCVGYPTQNSNNEGRVF